MVSQHKLPEKQFIGKSEILKVKPPRQTSLKNSSQYIRMELLRELWQFSDSHGLTLCQYDSTTNCTKVGSHINGKVYIECWIPFSC